MSDDTSQKNSETGTEPVRDAVERNGATDETRESTLKSRENAETGTAPHDETETGTVPPQTGTVPPTEGTVPPSEDEPPERLPPDVPPTPTPALTLDSRHVADTRSPPTALKDIPNFLYTPGTKRNQVARLIIFENINDAARGSQRPRRR